MPNNVTIEQATYQLLNDINNKYFDSGRQINKTSMLFQAVNFVREHKFVENLNVSTDEKYTLANVEFEKAKLTQQGQELLVELKTKYEKD